MLQNWFRKLRAAPPTAPAGSAPAVKSLSRRLNEGDEALATAYLCKAKSLMPLSLREAAVVVGYLQPRRYAAGEVLIQAGDGASSNYMLWILEGAATIEAVTSSAHNLITMTVLEPGSTVGEMGLMDGASRSATCTASTPMRCALLTRLPLQSLATRHPEVGVKLMFIVTIGVAIRLRDITEKFSRYVMMSNAMREEFGAAAPSENSRL
jgi:CRP/FNR family transcriptional regulator, cyclic AMP receptor protein